MATSRKEPLYPSRERATRMAPNLRPSSSESSSGYGARRARSVPSSPDRKFGPSAAAAAAAAAAPSAAPDNRPSLSHAGRSISSRTMASSGSSIHGRRPSSGSAAKPTLARAKSEKVTANSQRPPSLAVPLSNSFKDMAKTVSKSPSTLLKNKLSPRPCADKGVASPKPSMQRVPSAGPARGGKPLPVSSAARAPGAATKKANGGASASSRPKGATPQRGVVEPSPTRQEKDDEPSMQFEESESLTTPSIEDQLHEELPDPVDLKSIDIAASGSPRLDLQGPYSQQQSNNVEEVKEQSDKEDAGCGELPNGGHGADASKPDIAKVADELDRAETEEAKTKAAALANRTEVAQSWRKDDPKSNDVIEETKAKLLEERKSRVKALVGAFETVMSFKE